MNYLDLFSGIGGFALGAYWAGFKCENHFFSEIDSYCVELYQKRFPEAISLGDITKIDCDKLKNEWHKTNKAITRKDEGEAVEGDWIITGGFP